LASGSPTANLPPLYRPRGRGKQVRRYPSSKPGTTENPKGKMSEIGWTLHPQLHADTVPVCDLALSRVLAMNDANYPWLILVPRRIAVSEIFDLGPEQAILVDEVSLASRALKEMTQCDKLNVAAIGNVVPQLHIHIVARRKDDALWPKPVWGATSPRAYESAALERFATAIRDRLRSMPSFL
jgi:diadenosine tetraphosphate (Ap4A) HIT family hydrolase